MAIKWPVIDEGLFDDPATWNGGTVPGPDDDVYADGKTVYSENSITVKTLRTTQRPGGTAGGFFYAFSDNATITAESFIAGSSVCLVEEGIGTIVGNAYGGSSSNAAGVQIQGIKCSFIGNSYAGTGTSAHGLQFHASSINCIQIGDSYASSSQVVAHGTYLAGSGNLKVGNSYGANFNQTSGRTVGTDILGTNALIGNSYGGTGAYGSGSRLYAGGIIHGDCIGGSANEAHGVTNFSGGGYVFCNLAEGNTVNAYGAKITIGTLIIKEESGTYAKSYTANNVRTDDTYLTFLSYNSPTSTPPPGKIAKALASKFN